MKIALDAMGGDFAPAETVKGAVEAARERKIDIVLVGKRDLIQAELAKHNTTGLNLEVVDANEVIDMSEHPAIAVKSKRGSSIMVAMSLLKQGQVGAVVSAGNTGAMMAGALLALGRVPGIERPALAIPFPTARGKTLLLDVGANADSKPNYLVQFAQMGAIYVEKVFGVANPRVGLLNIGEEETKGSQFTQETHEMLKTSNVNFIGNVEGKDLPRGVADVVVTDGFTGNVALKTAEGAGELIFELIRESIGSSLVYKLAALVLKPALKKVAKRLDYAEYGGAPLLGVNGVVIISHGRSNAKAIKSALSVAGQAMEGEIVKLFTSRVVDKRQMV